MRVDREIERERARVVLSRADRSGCAGCATAHPIFTSRKKWIHVLMGTPNVLWLPSALIKDDNNIDRNSFHSQFGVR